MISKNEYELLKSLLESRPINLSKYINELNKLREEKLIKLHNVMYKNIKNVLDFGYDGFEVTQDGIRAIEEYEIFINTEQRNNETLQAAKEANNIASEANKNSRFANIIAAISLGGTILSLIFSIIAFVKSC